MKKLMIAAAIVCAAVAANAASVTWNWNVYTYTEGGGNLYKPSSDPTESGTGVNVGSATMYLFVALTDDFDIVELEREAVYNALMGGKSLATVASEKGASSAIAIKNGKVDTDTSVRVTTVGDDSLELAGTFAVFENGDTFFIDELAGVEVSASETGSDFALATYYSGRPSLDFTADSSSYQGAGWYAVNDVPEPTSALLMLLGMAGLALKRKRA